MTQSKPESAKIPDPTAKKPAEPAAKETEIGGFKDHDPTQHGDWQHRGRVTDF